MSASIAASRPAATSAVAAARRLLVTLVLFVATMLAFVLAPLLLLAVAAVAYAVARPSAGSAADRVSRSSAPRPLVDAHRFGSGV